MPVYSCAALSIRLLESRLRVLLRLYFLAYLNAFQVGSKTDCVMCFGPMVPDGYGVCYNPMDEHINIAITAFNSCEETNATKFARSVEDALLDMRTLLEDTAAAKHWSVPRGNLVWSVHIPTRQEPELEQHCGPPEPFARCHAQHRSAGSALWVWQEPEGTFHQRVAAPALHCLCDERLWEMLVLYFSIPIYKNLTWASFFVVVLFVCFFLF